jgi:DNA-binding transcriptional regulator GbsR (MarR family)
MTEPDPYADFVQRAASEFVAQGFPRMPAYVIMALTASEEGRLTSAELAERLSVSPAAISTATGYLSTLGFVRTHTVPGTRRHVYSLPERPWYTVSLTQQGIYSRIEHEIRASAEQLPHGSAVRARALEMADFFAFIDRRMAGLLDEWHAELAERRAAEAADEA